MLFTASSAAVGWQEIPDTRLHDVCPPAGFGGTNYEFDFHCKNITAFSGGAYDSSRKRLYIWGGGGNAYYGNEVYALDLASRSMLRLTDPAVPIADFDISPPQSELAPFDGTQPNARHTYAALIYIDHADRLWAFSGALAGRAIGRDKLTWLFNPATNTWIRDTPTGDIPAAAVGAVAAYDPVSKKVFLHDRKGLYSYEYNSGQGHYTQLTNDGRLDIHSTAVIDPERRLLFILGGGNQIVYDISEGSNFKRQNLDVSGATTIVDKYQAPGLAYDPVSRDIVGWVRDGRVYRLDPATGTFTATAFHGEPVRERGHTFGRFAYIPDEDRFVVYDKTTQNAFLFQPVRSGQEDTSPPEAPGSLTGDALLPSTARIEWTEPFDNFGVDGYRVYRDGVLVADTRNLRHAELGLTPGTSYQYEVTAYDSAGLEGAPSPTLTVTTPQHSVALPLGDCSGEPGLAGRSDIVFCEPWEDANWWQNDYLFAPIVNDPRPAKVEHVQHTQVIETGCLSGRCLKVDMAKGQQNSLSMYWPLAAAEKAPETLFLRYYLRLAPDWDPSLCNDAGDVVDAGGKFPGIADVRMWADEAGQCGNGGNRSNGIDCWSMRSSYRGCYSGDGEACATKPNTIARFGSYVYHYDQSASTGDSAWWDSDDWGQTKHDGGTCDSTPNNMFCGKGDGGLLEPDRWYRIEMQVTMNAPGQPDGVIRGWVDGVLSYEKTNTEFRVPGHDLLHNRLIWLNVYKGGKHGNCTSSSIFLDQLVVSTDTPPGGLDTGTEQPPVLSFAVEPPAVTAGDTATLNWQAGQATSCTASGAWSGARGVHGLETVSPDAAVTRYALQCDGPGGSVHRELTVEVTDIPPEGDDGAEPGPDVEAPTQPGKPTAVVVTENRVDIQWSAASDDTAVTGYRVFRNGVSAATVQEGTSFSDTGLSPGTVARYAVEAFDAAGNRSLRSAELVVTTHGESDSGVDGELTIAPDSDTYLFASSTYPLGDRPRLDITPDNAVYLRFPLDVIPPGVQINSARLRLHDYAQYGAIENVGVFRADKDWHESVTTHSHVDRSAGVRWDNAMGDWRDRNDVAQGDEAFAYSGDISDDDAGKWVEWDVTELARAWTSGSLTNQGLVLRVTAGNGKHVFASTEHADSALRPRLELTFSAASAPGLVERIAAADTYLSRSTAYSLGERTRLDVSSRYNTLLHFDLTDLLPGAVVKRAVLRLRSYAQSGDTPRAGVFAATKPWTEGGATRSHSDAVSGLAWNRSLGDWTDASGTPHGDNAFAETAIIDDDTEKWVEWDVTGLVEDWIGGARPNHGLLLRSIAGEGTSVFRSTDDDNAAHHPRLQIEFESGGASGPSGAPTPVQADH